VPSPAVRAAEAIERAEGLHHKQDVEHCYAFAGDGSRLFFQAGNVHEVPITPDLQDLLIRDGNAVLTHNHPSGRSFSPDDGAAAVGLNLAEIRAVGTDQLGRIWEHRLIRPPEGWPSEAVLRRTWEATSNAEQRRLQRLMRRGRITAEEARASFLHLVWLRDARRLRIAYRRRPI
jgi:hypothetical protein